MQCFHPVLVKKWQDKADGSKVKVNEFQWVPCGKCVACLSARRDAWTFRLAQEQAASDLSYFVGLTYDDDHIPIKRFGNIFFQAFNKRHCQLFLKRFRQRLDRFKKGVKCSYFLISEYGSETYRPHYHALLFIKGLQADAEKYIYQMIQDSWEHSINMPSIDPCGEAAIHYCTKYSLKDVGDVFKLEDYFHNEDGDSITWSDAAGTYLERPFMLCSTRPYIGSHREFKVEDHMNYNGADQTSVYFNGTRLSMPRIYRKKVGVIGAPQERSPDPRFSLDKYRELERRYFIDHPLMSYDEFNEYIDQYCINAEKKMLAIARRKKEKL